MLNLLSGLEQNDVTVVQHALAQNTETHKQLFIAHYTGPEHKGDAEASISEA